MMKSIMKRAASAVLATALVVTSVYCGGPDASAAVKTKKITMNKKKVNLVVGKKFTLKVKKVTPKKGSKAVTYKTSKKKVCTVSKKGVITAKAKGTATITVTSKVNKKAKAKVKVVVRKKTVAPTVTATATAATSTALVVSATPVATATATATVKPGKPTKTKKPAGTPTPTPTPRFEKPASTAPAAIKFDFKEFDAENGNNKGGFVNESPEERDENNVVTKKGASYKILDDGSMQITMTGQYAAFNFFLPDTAEIYYSNYKCAVVTYKLSGTSKDASEEGGSKIDLGYAVWDESCDPTSNERNTLGKHPNWGQSLVKSDEFKTLIVSKEGVADESSYVGEGIRAFQIFNPHEMDDKDSIVITVKSIYLYDEMKEEGFVPDESENSSEAATPAAIDLSKEGACILDGSVTATYAADKQELNCELAQHTGVIFKNAETDVDDYKYVKLTYKASAGFDAYVFNGQMGDEGKGHTPAGQTKVDSLVASDTYKTVVFNTEKMYGLKIVNMGGTATIDIKAVEFSKTEPSAE